MDAWATTLDRLAFDTFGILSLAIEMCKIRHIVKQL